MTTLRTHLKHNLCFVQILNKSQIMTKPKDFAVHLNVKIFFNDLKTLGLMGNILLLPQDDGLNVNDKHHIL